MKKKLLYNKILILTVFFALSVITGCNDREKKENQTDVVESVTPEIFNLTINEDYAVVNLPAEIVSDRQFDINAKILSYVKAINFDIGAEVKKGDIIIEFEAPEIKSQLSSLKSKISSQEAVAGFSEVNYRRLLDASETEGIISDDALDKLKSKKDSDIAILESLKADYEEKSAIAGYLNVKAPFSGIVTERNIDIGALVGPSGMSKPLMVLQDNKNLRLRFSAAERYTPYIKTGDSLSFSVRSIPEYNYQTVISRKSGALDSDLRSQLIECDMKNADQKFLPGMIADVKLKMNSDEPSYKIPKSALADTNKGIYVMAVIDGKTKKIMVRKKQETGMMVEIAGNLYNISAILKSITEDIKEGVEINLL